jgi:hypothetical protein
LSETTTPTAGSVVDGQLSVQGRGLEAEVVPVKLNDGAEGLIEVASGARLKVITGGEVVVEPPTGRVNPAPTKKVYLAEPSELVRLSL